MWAILGAGVLRWVIGGAAILMVIGGLYLKGRIDGNAACIARQQAQMDKMERYVRDVRSRIERNIPLDDSILRSDPFQRSEP